MTDRPLVLALRHSAMSVIDPRWLDGIDGDWISFDAKSDPDHSEARRMVVECGYQAADVRTNNGTFVLYRVARATPNMISWQTSSMAVPAFEVVEA